MRSTRRAQLAAGLAATVAIFTGTLPSNADSTEPVGVAARLR